VIKEAILIAGQDLTTYSRHASATLTLEKPTAIHYLVDCILEIQTPEAIVLVNGRYSAPDYILQDGDRVYVFSPLAGG
jgi:sulfur carrier protein ThiS